MNFKISKFFTIERKGKKKIINLQQAHSSTPRKKNNSILSEVCEALIGAIYLDSDIKEAKKFIQKYWKKKINKEITIIHF